MKFFTVLLFASLAATSLAAVPGKCAFLSALLSLVQAMGLSGKQYHHPCGEMIRHGMKKP